jgi:probable rRNA maturation factor
LGGGNLMNTYDIFNETKEDLDEYMDTLKGLLDYALKYENVDNAEFNIIFVSSDKIHEINKEYRGVDRVTDVISFALEDNEEIELDHRVLGDIYICVERAHEQAIEYGHSFLREICFLSVHGLLHLLGYDHMEEKDEKIMFGKQEEILNNYGIRRDNNE